MPNVKFAAVVVSVSLKTKYNLGIPNVMLTLLGMHRVFAASMKERVITSGGNRCGDWLCDIVSCNVRVRLVSLFCFFPSHHSADMIGIGLGALHGLTLCGLPGRLADSSGSTFL